MTTVVRRAPSVPGPAPSAPSARPVPWLRWWWVLAALAFYVGLVFALDPRGQLGSDVAAKVTTLEHMKQTNTTSPALPYWAAGADPDGRLFPLANATEVGDKWVAVATLPMLEAALPLYRLGGVRLTLALPIAGALLWAMAAAALARRIDRDPRLAFFVVAFASPAAIYAVSFWEHTLGVAAMLWAVVLLVDVRRGDRSPYFIGGAAALFGIAATMRTEALVYGAVFCAIFGSLRAWDRRSVVDLLKGGGASVVGLAVPLVANTGLERAVLGSDFRSQRAVSAASSSGLSPFVRLHDGAVTVFAPVANDAWPVILIGVLITIAVGLAHQWSRRPARAESARKLLIVALAVMGALMLSRFGFVPGLLMTMPLAIAGTLHLRNRERERELALASVVAVGVVLLVQYTSNVVPQWSGRYLLLSGAVLLVLGLGDSTIRRLLVGASMGVTAIGFVWMVERSHQVDAFFSNLRDHHADVVISRDLGLLRESGAVGADQHWLSAPSDADLDRALDVARRFAARTVVVIDNDDALPRSFDCYSEQDREQRHFLADTNYVFVTLTLKPQCAVS